MISKALMGKVRRDFALSLTGIHGEAHWARVWENGLRLAERTGADVEVVELFAYLHDSQRQNDGWDREHGRRAAEFVRSLPVAVLALCGERLELLTHACAFHSEGRTDGDITVRTCWDADRLDLGRINIQPDPRYLCTAAAREPEIIAWAYRRSQGAFQISGLKAPSRGRSRAPE